MSYGLKHAGWEHSPKDLLLVLRERESAIEHDLVVRAHPLLSNLVLELIDQLFAKFMLDQHFLERLDCLGLVQGQLILFAAEFLDWFQVEEDHGVPDFAGFIGQAAGEAHDSLQHTVLQGGGRAVHYVDHYVVEYEDLTVHAVEF